MADSSDVVIEPELVESEEDKARLLEPEATGTSSNDPNSQECELTFKYNFLHMLANSHCISMKCISLVHNTFVDHS